MGVIAQTHLFCRKHPEYRAGTRNTCPWHAGHSELLGMKRLFQDLWPLSLRLRNCILEMLFCPSVYLGPLIRQTEPPGRLPLLQVNSTWISTGLSCFGRGRLWNLRQLSSTFPNKVGDPLWQQGPHIVIGWGLWSRCGLRSGMAGEEASHHRYDDFISQGALGLGISVYGESLLPQPLWALL